MKSGAPHHCLPVIVVVEDERDCLAALEIALASITGFSVRGFTTAERAVAFLNYGQPAGLITDIHLPGLSGFDLIAHVRARFAAAPMPVIAVSGDPDPGTPHRARAAGADAFFLKPYSPHEICSTLEALIHDR